MHCRTREERRHIVRGKVRAIGLTGGPPFLLAELDRPVPHRVVVIDTRLFDSTRSRRGTSSSCECQYSAVSSDNDLTASQNVNAKTSLGASIRRSCPNELEHLAPVGVSEHGEGQDDVELHPQSGTGRWRTPFGLKYEL